MYHYSGMIVRWIDGDTVDMDIDLGFHITFRQRFRVLGVDTPERGDVNYDAARQFSQERFPVGSWIEVHTEKEDKYGRYLVDLPGLSDALIAAGLANAYPRRTWPGC